jgi:hypothetical protein
MESVLFSPYRDFLLICRYLNQLGLSIIADHRQNIYLFQL